MNGGTIFLDEVAELNNRIVGFHFYNPPAVQKLLEIITHSDTDKELIKKPELLLMEYPEKFVGIVNLEIFDTLLSDMLNGGMCAVFLSEHREFIETFSQRELVISKGTIQER